MKTRFNRGLWPAAAAVLMVAVLLLAAAGCGGADKDDQAVNGEEAPENVLVIGLGRDFYYGPQDRSYLHGSTNVWESLTYLGEDLAAEPMLAESFSSSEDGRVWTFQIREGVLFHDGEILDAEAVKKNIERANRHPSLAPTYNKMLEVRVTAPMTVEIELSEPSPTFPELISYHSSPIFSPAVIDDEGTDIREPMGTGPYIFSEYRNDQIVLEANEDYWGGRPPIDRVVFYHIPDENTRVAALKSGEVNVLADVGVILPDQMPSLDGHAGIEIKTVDVLTSIYLHFQNQNPPFDEPALRRAVALVIDRDEVVDKLSSGFGKPAEGMLTPLGAYWVNPAAAPCFDLDEAARITAEHDITGTTIDLLVCANWARRWPILSIAQYLQTELNKLGFNVALRSLEMGAYMEEVRKGNYHISLTPWTGSDPDDFFRAWIDTGGSFNTARGLYFSDPAADNLIAGGRSEMNRETRRQIYYQLQEIVAASTPISPIYHDVTIYAVRDYIRDFYMDFNFRPNLHRAIVVH